jgi:hypothetical protein
MLSGISISAIQINNEPFFRSLTATLMCTLSTEVTYLSTNEQEDNFEYIIRDNFYTEISSPFITLVSSQELITQAQIEDPHQYVLWTLPPNAYAVLSAGDIYVPSPSALSAVGTLYVYFSGETYDYKTNTIPFDVLNIQASLLDNDQVETPSDPEDVIEGLSAIEIAEYALTYDLFPDIDFDLKLNYESTENSLLFYRTVSATPYSAYITFKSDDITFVQGASANNVIGWYTVDNNTKYTELSTTINTTFLRDVPQTHTVTAYVSVAKLSAELQDGIGDQLTETSQLTAGKYIVLENKFNSQFTLIPVPSSGSLEVYPLSDYSPIGFSLPLLDNYNVFEYEQSYYVFHTPHIIKRTLSAVFVNSFLKADFEGFPVLYFDENNFIQTLSGRFEDSFRTDTKGLSFYGEGHTEYIMLTAYNDPAVDNFIWKFNNSQDLYTLLTENNGLSGELIVPSQPDVEERIPISLQVTNSTFPSSSPLYYFDDVTGEQKTYPYFTTTVDISGNELSNNTPLKQSITIKRYPDLEYYFTPGLTSPLLLPINGGPQFFNSTFNLGLCGPVYVDPCFEKYNLSWKWSTFEQTSISSFTNVPSSWATMETLGSYPKRWRYQPATFIRTIPTVCESSNLTWTLCTNHWNYTKYVYDSSSTLSFSASLSTDGSNLFTTSVTDDTELTVAVSRLATCIISADPFDWLPKEKIYSESYKTIAVAPPDLRVYTSNRYVLLSTDTIFDNISRNTDFITLFTIDLDEGNVFTYTNPSDIPTKFNIQYKERGPKSIKITAKVSYSPLIIEESFPNIVTSIEQYEDVDPANYRSEFTKLDLPWSEQPRVFANDWVTDDNINVCFKKFYENLQYLEDRSELYDNTYTDYFGYLGVIPKSSQFSCPVNWTWEQLTCGTEILTGTELVTWTDVFSGENELTTGKYAKCGTWEQQKRRDLPKNCNGKHCVEWKWSSRREINTSEPITWRQTRLYNIYAKKWSYEPCETSPDIACDEGIWNVNIPKLDKYYNAISVCDTQNTKCNYNDVFSYNNVLYLAQSSQIKVLSSDFTATFVDFQRTFDGITNYSYLKRIVINNDKTRVYTLDENAGIVSVYLYDIKKGFNRWRLFTTWGGYGGTTSKHKFNTPTDIHLDQDEDIWVTDSGNNALKHYTNTGAWIKTITTEDLHANKPVSVAVDSQYNVHVLTQSTVFVFAHYSGELLFKYDISSYVTDEVVKISTSYNREILYIATKTQVLKFFRTGIFNDYIVNNINCITNITSVFHDEHRNLLITTNDKVLKFADLMLKRSIKSELPPTYWQLNDLYIDKEEYVQNWVYNKSLQRLWDNIELFRNALFYEKTGCKAYTPPVYDKKQIIIGQNEIVTSTTINRVLGYLWKNFITLLPYYDPDCRL